MAMNHNLVRTQKRFFSDFSMSSDIIYPPPDIKNVIDKTAEFVAKVGDDFEKKVATQQGGQAKFAFLNASNPYRRYYDLRVRELREGKGMHFSIYV